MHARDRVVLAEKRAWGPGQAIHDIEPDQGKSMHPPKVKWEMVEAEKEIWRSNTSREAYPERHR